MHWRISGKNSEYTLFAISGVQALGAGVTQDEETSLEQISRQKIVEQIGFLPSYCRATILSTSDFDRVYHHHPQRKPLSLGHQMKIGALCCVQLLF